MDYLNHFNNINEMQELAKKIDFPIKYWKITNESLEKRVELAKDEKFFTKMQKYANNKFEFNEEEIITWFDNMYLINKVLSNFESQNNNIHIIQELCLPFSNKRSDIVLCYENKILIIEFSYTKHKSEYKYDTKLDQAIRYKVLLENVVSSDKIIGTYVFLNKPDEENKNINNNEILKLQNFIEYFFFVKNQSAIDEILFFDF
jgi:hypothetical protein